MAFENSQINVYNKYLPKGFLLDENFQEPSTDGSDIVNYFNNKYIFLTGGTGFLGKLLVEKLLRTCPDISGIFVLVRAKKGKDFHSRLDDIYEDVLYDRLKRKYPKFRHKITAINGDVTLPNLGINEDDRKLIMEKVSIIFHSAATVRFDESLKLAIQINVMGSYEMIKLAKSCKNLTCFMHVSTAFTHCPLKEIDEKFYDLNVTPSEIIEMIETMTEEEINAKTDQFLANYPNTYAFTKAIAENLVREYCEDIPTCVFRPAVVIATYNEPLKGWTDNLYGPIGLLIGIATGVVRVVQADHKIPCEFVPADYVINAMIASAYKKGIEQSKDLIPIYNYVSSCEKPLYINTLTSALDYVHLTPSIRTIWYNIYVLTNNKFFYSLLTFFLHTIPAFLADLVGLLMGKKPRFIKLYKKIAQLSELLSYFSLGQWDFKNTNVQKLWNNINNVDKTLYPFNMKDLNWNQYFKYNVIGIRTYLMKEDFSTIPAARKKFQRFYYAHRTLQAIFLLIVLKLLYVVVSTIF